MASAAFRPSSSHRLDNGWRGSNGANLVVYELHVGTFTPEGTFAAVIPKLDALRDLGINCVELMPIGEFPGSRSWGYDGVFPFAPQSTYGGPQGLRELVAACHARGLAIFLDVDLQPLRPGRGGVHAIRPLSLREGQAATGGTRSTDGPGLGPVRAMVLDNARMWIRDYGFDGLRLDAADQIYDRGPSPILAEIADAAIAKRCATRLPRPTSSPRTT